MIMMLISVAVASWSADRRGFGAVILTVARGCGGGYARCSSFPGRQATWDSGLSGASSAAGSGAGPMTHNPDV